MKYAFITGDAYTKFEPMAIVFDGQKFEIICESQKRQQHYHDYVMRAKVQNLDELLNSFSYQSVETGEVTPEVESVLNTLRARYGLYQIADEELNNVPQQNPDNDRRLNALMKISKRMRTGANER